MARCFRFWPRHPSRALRVSCSLPHPRDVHFCSLARLQGRRNMAWSARKWRNYIRGREKGGCKSKRSPLSLSFSRAVRGTVLGKKRANRNVEGEEHELVIYRRELRHSLRPANAIIYRYSGESLARNCDNISTDRADACLSFCFREHESHFHSLQPRV